jgi:two-component system, NarL family, sensor histidine kinase DevS
MTQSTRPRDSEDRLRAQLGAFNEATLTITAELSLDRVLQRIAHLARELAGARYAALGVPDDQGGLERFLTSGMSEEQVARMERPPEGKGLLGALLRSTTPIRVPRIADDPRSAGFCANHPQMTSFLGVPIISKGTLLGTLYLTDKIGADEFSQDDEQLIVMLAAHAAIAIENARLYQQVQRLAVLEERERIGMDLHDGIIQSIYAVGLTLEYCNLLLDEDPLVAKGQLGQAIAGLNDVIRDIRNYILDLRPQRFQGKDLPTGLFELIRAFRANTLIQADLQVDLDGDVPLLQTQASGLFHIAQEALANVAKHARARQVSVVLSRDKGYVSLTIRDDGRGFDPARVATYVGHGMRNMDARAHALGGRLSVESEAGKGTTVKATVPIEPIGGRGT